MIVERTPAPGLDAARSSRAQGGRPSTITPAKRRQIKRIPMAEIAEVLGVSRTTLYRHLDG